MNCGNEQVQKLTSIKVRPSTEPSKMTRVRVIQVAVVINYAVNYVAIKTNVLPVLHDEGAIVCLCEILGRHKTTGFKDIRLITCAVACDGAEQGWKHNNVGARDGNP